MYILSFAYWLLAEGDRGAECQLLVLISSVRVWPSVQLPDNLQNWDMEREMEQQRQFWQVITLSSNIIHILKPTPLTSQ